MWYVRHMSAPFDVLAEPVRRRILDLLLERPRLVGELTGQLGISQPGTSKHLRVLREAGLVRVRPDAQRRWYELRPEPLVELDAWLAPYRRLWADRLDALERHLDSMPDEPESPDEPERPDEPVSPEEPKDKESS
jgi:DNA-binding transcriptional ArsR family regulator